MKLSELRDRRMLVLGLGREGLATAEFLRERFPDVRFGLADRLPYGRLSDAARAWIDRTSHLDLHLGADYGDAVRTYDVVVKSPGVRSHSPEIDLARGLGKTITSQAEIFFSNWPGTVVAVTGTKGKSTTATLIYKMLCAAGRSAFLVGNIGQPPLERLADAPADAVFVYELSSQQLEGLCIVPHIAVLLGLVAEHLDYHADLAAYLDAKENITRSQGADDWLVFAAGSPHAAAMARRSHARCIPVARQRIAGARCAVVDEVLTRFLADGDEAIIATAEISLPGAFNLDNVLAAATAATLLDVPVSAIAGALREFEPLEHRFELVGTFSQISFYNASIATVPEATIAHLDALARVDTLLVGGYDRGLDFDELARHIVAHGVANLILFPTTGSRIRDAVLRQCAAVAPPRMVSVASMAEAVAVAFEHTPVGGTCLLSPAAASFGLFRDYRERGDAFKSSVREIGARQP